MSQSVIVRLTSCAEKALRQRNINVGYSVADVIHYSLFISYLKPRIAKIYETVKVIKMISSLLLLSLFISLRNLYISSESIYKFCSVNDCHLDMSPVNNSDSDSGHLYFHWKSLLKTNIS